MRSSSTPSTASATVSRTSNVGGGGGGHCGLEIVGVEDRDRGSWECEVGAVINDDFKTKTDNIVLDVKSKFHLSTSNRYMSYVYELCGLPLRPPMHICLGVVSLLTTLCVASYAK